MYVWALKHDDQILLSEMELWGEECGCGDPWGGAGVLGVGKGCETTGQYLPDTLPVETKLKADTWK